MTAALLLAAAACTKAPKEDAPQGIPYPLPRVSSEGEVIAKIGAVPITTAEIETRIRKESPFTRGQLTTPANKARFVDGALRMELLAQEAWRRKMHEDPKFLERYKQILVTELMNQEMAKLSDKLEVTEAELLEAYKARDAEFNKPAKIRVAQIVRYVDTPGARAKAKRQLKKIEAEVLAAERKNDPRAFSRFAKESSEDEPTKNRGGDLSFLTRDALAQRYGEGVAKFLFDDVKVGDMGIADADNAVVLFKKTGRRRGVTRTLEQVRPQLRSQLVATKRGDLFDAFVNKLMTERGVEVNRNLIDGIKVDLDGLPTGRTPPAPPR